MRIHEYTLKEFANFTGLHYSTISVIAKRVNQDKQQNSRRDPVPRGSLLAGRRAIWLDWRIVDYIQLVKAKLAGSRNDVYTDFVNGFKMEANPAAWVTSGFVRVNY